MSWLDAWFYFELIVVGAGLIVYLKLSKGFFANARFMIYRTITFWHIFFANYTTFKFSTFDNNNSLSGSGSGTVYRFQLPQKFAASTQSTFLRKSTENC